MVGIIIQGLIAFNDASYVFHNYHGTLLSIGVVAFAILFNTVLANRLPLMEGLLVILHVLGFFAIIIPLWIMAPRTSPEIALLQFTNNGGWSTTGLAAMVGLNGPLSVLIGYDCSVHMCKSNTPHSSLVLV
jgi:choline transport protein